jgi:hypothetical protein
MASQACIFRRSPKFKRSQFMVWDESPVPLDSISAPSYSLGKGNVRLHREQQDLLWSVLVGDGSRRSFHIGMGWDCELDVTLSDGTRYRAWQQAMGDSSVRIRATTHEPRIGSTEVWSGSFTLTPWRLTGGTAHGGHLQITRSRRDMSISLEYPSLGVRREWRIDQPAARRVRVFDLAGGTPARPSIVVSSDDLDSLKKTARWLVLELTGIVVAEGFLLWNVPEGHQVERSSTTNAILTKSKGGS